MNFNSEFLRDFFERGFFAQATHPEELDNILSNESIPAYIGFDCTADSLHAGSLIQIMILRLLQKHGHKPIILLGGGTTKIGDPSGKDEARKVLDDDAIQKNLDGIKKTLEKFISFEGNSAATLVNNDDWLKNINYIDFLRDVGRHFSINRMLTFDSVKTRLDREQSLSFLEFNYMILQAYDFYELNKSHDCRLQIGGSDQWGNIVNGVELTRRIAAANSPQGNNQDKKRDVFGLTSPLLTTSDGKKMGKTADGAIWLDPLLLSPFDYFQYFRNSHDADIEKFLKLFTELEISEIEALGIAALKDGGEVEVGKINKAKEILAFEATKICHGQIAADAALNKAKEIFISKNTNAYELKEISLGDSASKKLTDIMKEIGAVESSSQGKRMIEGKAVKIDGEAILDPRHSFNETTEFNLSVGKKKFFKIIIA